MVDFQHKEKNLPFYYNFINNIISQLPSCNSLLGIIFYSFIAFIFVLLFNFITYQFSSKKNKNDKELDNEFKANLEETRKKKAEEAMKLLKKVQ